MNINSRLSVPIIKHVLHGDDTRKVSSLAKVLTTFQLSVNDYDRQLDPVKPTHTTRIEL